MYIFYLFILDDFSDQDDNQKKCSLRPVEPLVLTTTIRNDVKVRNILADLRASPIRPRHIGKKGIVSDRTFVIIS